MFIPRVSSPGGLKYILYVKEYKQVYLTMKILINKNIQINISLRFHVQVRNRQHNNIISDKER